MGTYIAPQPNRLVVIAGGNPHMIHKVSAAAGDHVRCTIAGFFMVPRR
jgi:Rps23 Pro-64 3,4-dihydroxylase Tpa1-like proline 4-hydroxylase